MQTCQKLQQPSAETLVLLYDGECSICSRYRDYVRLRAKHSIEIRNARESLDLIEGLRAAGHEINTGMIVLHRSHVYQGPQAVVYLNQLLSAHNVLDRVRMYFSSNLFVVRSFYWLIKLMRLILLRIKGVDPNIVK